MALKDIFNKGMRNLKIPKADRGIPTIVNALNKEEKRNAEREGIENLKVQMLRYKGEIASKLNKFAQSRGLLSSESSGTMSMSYHDLELAWVFVIRHLFSNLESASDEEYSLYDEIKEVYPYLVFMYPRPFLLGDGPRPFDPLTMVDINVSSLYRLGAERVKPYLMEKTILIGDGENLPLVKPEFLMTHVEDVELRQEYLEYAKQNMLKLRKEVLGNCDPVLEFCEGQEFDCSKLFHEFVARSKRLEKQKAIKKLNSNTR